MQTKHKDNTNINLILKVCKVCKKIKNYFD